VTQPSPHAPAPRPVPTTGVPRPAPAVPSAPGYLAAVRTSYDTVADAYLARVPTPADLDPLSRSTLSAFAEFVRAADRGPVADVGCGPGLVTGHLAGLGVRVLGVDLSPRMVGLARRGFPDLDFAVGSMTALPVADGRLGGVLAHYATHHTPPDELPVVYAEFRRVLAPGGWLMLSGHVGDDEHTWPTRAYGGLPVSYESFLLPAERIAALLERAGLEVVARLTRPAPAGAGRASATLLARRPEPAR
jgi:SAM-dependent methyltransferase